MDRTAQRNVVKALLSQAWAAQDVKDAASVEANVSANALQAAERALPLVMQAAFAGKGPYAAIDGVEADIATYKVKAPADFKTALDTEAAWSALQQKLEKAVADLKLTPGLVVSLATT